MDQGVVGGHERDRYRRGLDERPIPGDRHDETSIGHRHRAERVRDETHHPVSWRKVVDLWADLEHDPCALAADRGLTGVDPQGHQYVAEVQSCAVQGDPDLAWLQRL